MVIKVSEQKILSFTIAYMVSFLGLLNCINAISNILGFNTSVDTIIMYVSLWIFSFYVYANTILRRELKIDIFIGVVCMALLFIVTPILFPANEKFIYSASFSYADNPLLIVFVYSLTGYVAVRHLKSYDWLVNYLRYFSYIIIILSSIVYFFVKGSFANQYMTLSYNMLLQVCMIFCFPPKKNLFFHYVMLISGIFVIALGGARGALVGLIAGILLEVLMSKKNKKIVIVLIVLSIIVLLFYQQILLMLVSLMEMLGMSSRNLMLFFSNSGDITSGRTKMLIEMTKSLNVFGHGLYGDRVVLGGTYAHNLFFEWLIEFGIIGGGILSIAFLALVVFGLKNSNGVLKKLMIVFIPNGVVGLMFSGSYLNYQPAFFCLLGLFVNFLILSQKNNDINKDLEEIKD